MDRPVVSHSVFAGRYTLERELGHGGMATVYLATDLKLHRPVALKLLHPDLNAALGPERFLREIAVASRLNHPHILALHDSGETNGQLFYAMPYVEGESLRQRLEREPQLPVDEAVRIVRAIASALDYSHQADVVHRDIKPENILLARDPGGGLSHPLVADFGLARALDAAGGERLTATGLALGTPAYMSPEQIAGSSHVDARTDIYALGCVMYEMLAGAPPFTGPTAQAILARHSVDPVPPLRTVRPALSQGIEAAVERALAKVPADRFATAGSFAEALTREPPAGFRQRAPSTAAARSWLAGAASAAALAGLVAGGLLVRRGSALPVPSSASTIAVLPVWVPSRDSSLIRLGRDLATTVSATLDGVGGIRTADRQSVASGLEASGEVSPAAAASLARRLGAASVLRGTLVGDGAMVRLDLGLYATDDLEPLAQGITVSGHRDSLAGLTDSVVWTLLRRLWQRGDPPSPSLAAVTTRSVPALRAFLDGERAVERDQWDEAALAFRSAVAADSGFTLAYFRYAQARSWWEQEIEPEMLKAIEARRAKFPEPERLLVDAWLEDSLAAKLDVLEDVTQRFPDYWPGWFQLGDFFYHVGPILGFNWTAAQKALERAVTLNPRLRPAWDHLFVNSVGKDSAESRRALAGLEALPRPRVTGSQYQPGNLPQLRLLDAVDRAGGVIGPKDSALADSLARQVVSPEMTQDEKDLWSLRFLWTWNPRGQVEFNRRVLRLTTDPAEEARQFRGIAWAWAERGAWDSALAALAEAEMREPDPAWIGQYSIAVLGAFLGALPPERASRLRLQASGRVNEMEPGSRKADLLGALAWRDGVLAFARGDRIALERARSEARRSGHPQSAVIDRSLAAFGRALRGERAAAGRELAALERECLDGCGGSVTPNIAAHRFAAATWLLEAGDTAQAARLLIWHEARFDRWIWSFISRPLAYLMLARIEEARGDLASARAHYAQFLRHYDSPMPAQQHLVAEARTALTRLTGQPGIDPTEDP